mgnify:CR=1 FL=1
MNLHLRRTLLLLPLLSLLFLTLGAANLSAQSLDYNYLFVSTRAAGTTEDGLAYEPGDIIGAQGLGGAWFMAFDASDNGLTANQNVNAFDLTVPELNGNAAAVPGAIYLTFSQPRVRVPGVPGFRDFLIHTQDCGRLANTHFVCLYKRCLSLVVISEFVGKQAWKRVASSIF